MLITTTLMFSACIAVLCEGNLPHPTVEDFDGGQPTEPMVIAWAALAAISFVSLLACIFIILATQARMAECKYHTHNGALAVVHVASLIMHFQGGFPFT